MSYSSVTFSQISIMRFSFFQRTIFPLQVSIIILYIGSRGTADAVTHYCFVSRWKKVDNFVLELFFELYDGIIFSTFFEIHVIKLIFTQFIPGIVMQRWNATSSHRFSITLLNKSNSKFLWCGHVFFFYF